MRDHPPSGIAEWLTVLLGAILVAGWVLWANARDNHTLIPSPPVVVEPVAFDGRLR